MIRAIVLLSFLIAVASFSSPSTRSSSSKLSMGFNFGSFGKKSTPAPSKKQPTKAAPPSFAYGLVGSDVEAPEFDPLQLSAGKSEETIQWYRAAELKHGRITMLAALGLSVSPAFHLPDPVFDTTEGIGAVTKLYNERPEAIWQIVLGNLTLFILYVLLYDEMNNINR